VSIGLQNTSCDVGLHLEKVTEYSVAFWSDKKLRWLPDNVGCTPLEVVIMTTAYGMHQTFSGRHIQLFIIFDLYRFLPIAHWICR